MNNILKIASVIAAILCSLACEAQTNSSPGALSTNNAALVAMPASEVPAPAPTATATSQNILAILQSYLVDNDPTCYIWNSNHFTLWQGAVFSSVNGTPGASAVGNDLGAAIPIHKYNISIESVTRFEQLFGDVHSQAVGVQYNYDLHQIQLSGGVDVECTFANNAWRAVPFLQFAKASTTLAGLCPIFRYEFPVQKDPGAGRVIVGICLPL